MKVVGYGVCGSGESERYLKSTLDEFARLTDETIILGNNLDLESRKLIESYGFSIVDDDREWGKNQNKLKEDFVRNHVAKLNPDITICLDMDENFYGMTKQDFIDQCEKGEAWYVYIANLWDDGWNPDWSFWNVRFYSWKWREKLGDVFFKFENRPLHCGLAPKWTYMLNLHSPFLLEHHGLKKKADRDRKIKRYEQYDPNQVYRDSSYYNALKSDYSENYDPDDLLKTIQADVSAMKQPLNKELPQFKDREPDILIKREYDDFLFTVPESKVGRQLKQNYKGEGFIAI